MKTRRYLGALGLLVLGTLLGSSAFLQQQKATPEQRLERFKTMSRQAEEKGLAEPFRGITTNGQVQPGLFSIRSTGVSTEPVRKAADAFLAALSQEQRNKTRFPVNDDEWRKWMNQHFYLRQGVSFAEMNDAQREKAFGLLRASLSANGLKLSRDIMRLNHTLGELNSNDFEQYGEWLYWITIMGEPSAREPWGWQIDGHHLIINYFVLGDQVVMSPAFFGSEPAVARSGKFQGTAILQDEQAAGLSLIRSLDGAQQKKAVIKVSKTGNDNVSEAFKDNVTLDYAGIRATELTASQKRGLLALAARWVNNMENSHAKVRMEEVERHLDNTWFAWIGGMEDSSVFYFRIQSPVILVEFDHQQPANLRHLAADPRAPNREHIHTVLRTPNGNDYGKDLLRQHYAQHPH